MAEVAMNGNGPYFLILNASASGYNVTATLQWRRNAWNHRSWGDNRAWSITIDGTVYTGTYNFDAPAGGAIGPQTIAVRSKTITKKTSVAVAGLFTTNTSDGGNGSLSISLSLVPSAPPAPTNLASTAVAASFRIAAPSQSGAFGVSSYQMQVLRADGTVAATWTAASVGTTTSPATLAPDTPYTVRYRARTEMGDGAWSPSVSVRTQRAGMWVGKSGAHVPAPAAIGIGAGFTDAAVFVCSGGTYVPAT